MQQGCWPKPQRPFESFTWLGFKAISGGEVRWQGQRFRNRKGMGDTTIPSKSVEQDLSTERLKHIKNMFSYKQSAEHLRYFQELVCKLPLRVEKHVANQPLKVLVDLSGSSQSLTWPIHRQDHTDTKLAKLFAESSGDGKAAETRFYTSSSDLVFCLLETGCAGPEPNSKRNLRAMASNLLAMALGTFFVFEDHCCQSCHIQAHSSKPCAFGCFGCL